MKRDDLWLWLLALLLAAMALTLGRGAGRSRHGYGARPQGAPWSTGSPRSCQAEMPPLRL
jgi:hypothetical protein